MHTNVKTHVKILNFGTFCMILGVLGSTLYFMIEPIDSESNASLGYGILFTYLATMFFSVGLAILYRLKFYF